MTTRLRDAVRAVLDATWESDHRMMDGQSRAIRGSRVSVLRFGELLDALRAALEEEEGEGCAHEWELVTFVDGREACLCSECGARANRTPIPAPPAASEADERDRLRSELSALREGVRTLLSEADMLAYPIRDCYGSNRKDEREAPFWSESGLYGRVGKEAARTILARANRLAALVEGKP